MTAGLLETPLHVRDIDQMERRLARIEPNLIIIYNSVLITVVELPLAFLPQIYRIPNYVLAASSLVLVLLGVYCLNKMSKGAAVLMTAAPIVQGLVAALLPAYFAFQLWLERSQAYWRQNSISLDPYSFGDPAAGPVLWSPRNLQLAITFLIGVAVFFTITCGWVTVARLSPDERLLLRSHHMQYSTRRGITNLTHILTIGYVTDWSAANFECQARFRSDALADISTCTRSRLDDGFWEFYAEAAAASLIIVLGDAILRLARKQIRLSAQTLLSTDARPPILFLRSFRDDQVKLPASPKRTWLGRLLSLCQPVQPFDHVLLDEGTARGPVVALGSPRDKLPPYGVSRGYFENKDWKQAVEDLARMSQIIVICLDDTEGVWWEIDHIDQQRHERKTLFLFHPHARDRTEHATVVAKLRENLQSGQGEMGRLRDQLCDALADGGIIGFFIADDGTLQLARSQWFSAYSYLLTLRWFLRTKGLGGHGSFATPGPASQVYATARHDVSPEGRSDAGTPESQPG
jgi:hypothetical protein